MKEEKEKSIWETIDIYTWKDFTSTVSQLNDEWIFRGQKSVIYNLSTSYYRALKESLVDLDEISFKIDGYYLEKSLLYEFLTKYPNHTDIAINDNSLDSNAHAYSLMSVMQHYGAPTRLQDWSRCSKIAAFFAFDGASLEEDSCVYALNSKILEDIYWEKIDRKYNLIQGQGKKQYESDVSFRKNIDNSFEDFDHDFDILNQTARLFEPVISNKRLRAQKGVFLVPSQPFLTISDILENYDINEGFYQGESIAKKFVFKKDNLLNFIKILTQKEKITHEEVYPGLEGLSLSIKQVIRYNNLTPKLGKKEMEDYLKNLE